MYAKPELTHVGSAVNMVLGVLGEPEETNHIPVQKIGPGIATNLDE